MNLEKNREDGTWRIDLEIIGTNWSLRSRIIIQLQLLRIGQEGQLQKPVPRNGVSDNFFIIKQMEQL